MSRKLSLLLFSLAMVLYGSQLWASGLYYGAKTGTMVVDGSSKDPKNASLVVGYDLGLVVADVGLEGELSRTINDGEFGNSKFQLDTNAVYVAVRTAGPFYFKARGGYIDTNYSISGIGGGDSGTSYGVGLGLGLGLLQIELEYTLIDDHSKYLTLGVQF